MSDVDEAIRRNTSIYQQQEALLKAVEAAQREQDRLFESVGLTRDMLDKYLASDLLTNGEKAQINQQVLRVAEEVELEERRFEEQYRTQSMAGKVKRPRMNRMV